MSQLIGSIISRIIFEILMTAQNGSKIAVMGFDRKYSNDFPGVVIFGRISAIPLFTSAFPQTSDSETRQ
jgi:hypothetical protein